MSSSEEDEGDDGSVYEVDRIISVKVVDGERLYRVRWVGYSSDSDTWEPYENLTNCKELVRAFLTAQKKKLLRKRHLTAPCDEHERKNDSEIKNGIFSGGVEAECPSSCSKSEVSTSINKESSRGHVSSTTATSSQSNKDNGSVEGSHDNAVPSKQRKLVYKIPKKSPAIQSNAESSASQKQSLFTAAATSHKEKTVTNIASENRAINEKQSVSHSGGATFVSKATTQFLSDPLQTQTKTADNKKIQRKRTFQTLSNSSPTQNLQSDKSTILKNPVSRPIKVISKMSAISSASHNLPLFHVEDNHIISQKRPFPEPSSSHVAAKVQTNKSKNSSTSEEKKSNTIHSGNVKNSLKNSTKSQVLSKTDSSQAFHNKLLHVTPTLLKQNVQSGNNRPVRKMLAGPLKPKTSVNKSTKDSVKNVSDLEMTTSQNLGTANDKRPTENQKQVLAAPSTQPMCTQSNSSKSIINSAESHNFSSSLSDSTKEGLKTSEGLTGCLPNSSMKNGSQSTLAAVSAEIDISPVIRDLSEKPPANDCIANQKPPVLALPLSRHETDLNTRTLQQTMNEQQQISDDFCGGPNDQHMCNRMASPNQNKSTEVVSESIVVSTCPTTSNSADVNSTDVTVKIPTCNPDTSPITSHHHLETPLIGQIDDGSSIRTTVTEEIDAFCDTATNNKLLMQAAKVGNYTEVEKIIRRSRNCDLEQANDNGTTLLMTAATCGYADTVKVLVLGGADINASHSQGSTALIQACKHGHFSTVVVLLALGAHLNVQTRDGATALIKASKCNYLQIVTELLQYGADFSIKNCNGKTALQYAQESKFVAIEEVIIKHITRVKTAFESLVNTSINNSAQIVQELFSIRCFSLNEGNSFKINFVYKEQGSMSKGVGMLLYLAHSIINAEEVKCRLHGKCAVQTVLLNGKTQFPLTEDGNYILSCCPVKNGQNELIIKTDCFPATQVKLLAHAYKLQLTIT